MMLQVLLCSCLLWTAALAGLVVQESSGWVEATSLLYNGVLLRRFQRDDERVVEPYIALRVPQDQYVRVDPLGQGFYFNVLLEINNSSVKLPKDRFRWNIPGMFDVYGFEVELRKAVQGTCGTECPPVTVSGNWDKGREPQVTFRCRSRAACQGALQALRFTGPDHDELRFALKFIFYGQAHSKRFELTRVGLPVTNAISRPFSNAFWFEGDKLLLYTIEANSGFLAYETFQSEQTYSVPEDGSLPRIYRSGLLDQLGQVAATGRWQIVAEMRTAGQVVSQAVFSAEASGLDKNSWFSASRLLSTKPYWFGRSNYNIFSVDGDVRDILRRRFQINRHYGGCLRDTGLFYVSDMNDACAYSNSNKPGPILVYGTTDKMSYHAGSVSFAERFLVYLMLDRPVLPPFATTPSALPWAFNFEDDKVLLFTVKANSGHEAVATYLSWQPSLLRYTSGGLPDVYRSDLIDSMGAAVVTSGKQFIVAEMRVGDRMVSQVVFDVSINRLSLDKRNWFNTSRFVSSYPYQAVRSLTQNDTFFHDPDVLDPRSKLFSISGDERRKRGFFIQYSDGGCSNDKVFWVVSDAKDECLWGGHNDWTGEAPVLKYTENQGTPMQTKDADRFLIYLK